MTPDASLTITSGPWTRDQIADYLTTSLIPMRVATSGRHFPLVQSLWFVYADTALWCATQRDSVVVRRITAHPRVGFEIAADSPPYRGVRGHGRAALLTEPAREVLTRLIDRYLGDRQVPLAQWLLARADTEVAIRIDHLAVTSWDFSARMSASDGRTQS
jgi:nitroimidazol reductase NimA-like FMN-containing flavoprotein (pyridoxamine 5'-phosphate oxidase superfamily)